MTRRLIIAGATAVVAAFTLSGSLAGWDPAGAIAGAQRTPAGPCGLGDLPAAYALHGDGRAAGGPFALVGRVVFHADGTISGANTEVWNGSVDNTTYTGTYSIDPTTCRGTVKFVEEHQNPIIPNLHRAAFVVAAGGQRGFFTLTDNSYQQLAPGESPLPLDTITVSGVAERI